MNPFFAFPASDLFTYNHARATGIIFVAIIVVAILVNYWAKRD